MSSSVLGGGYGRVFLSIVWGEGLESIQELKRLGRSRYLPLLDEFLDSTPLPPELPYPPNQTNTYPCIIPGPSGVCAITA